MILGADCDGQNRAGRELTSYAYARQRFPVRAKLVKFQCFRTPTLALPSLYDSRHQPLRVRVQESLLMSKARPKFLNLFQIRQPAPAIVSILHRISGAALFLFLWL